MKKIYSHIMLLLVIVVMTATTVVAHAQQATPDHTLAAIESMPRNKAISKMTNWLDATAQAGKKEYKNLIASLEEMLSEPTWNYHNEELFALVMEHAATASCFSDNEKLRPRMMLEVTRKNAPGNVANDINYETIDGTRCKLSEISTNYTLIYFNDHECLSCAKVKERLDTCTTLKNMVSDSTLTVIGIYPYDNVEEWHLEPFPSYIINGWDYNQEVEGQQTYDLMTMPMFYLLDREKRVILKNEASLNRVLKSMTALKGLENSDIETKLDAVW
ncbi:MAG: DUF5106 domain-containing protein [Muribaculaceae bacterium]|nr:DUF5106 domain-containing protein [Muribaculaceae bacterium]